MKNVTTFSTTRSSIRRGRINQVHAFYPLADTSNVLVLIPAKLLLLSSPRCNISLINAETGPDAFPFPQNPFLLKVLREKSQAGLYLQTRDSPQLLSGSFRKLPDFISCPRRRQMHLQALRLLLSFLIIRLLRALRGCLLLACHPGPTVLSGCPLGPFTLF